MFFVSPLVALVLIFAHSLLVRCCPSDMATEPRLGLSTTHTHCYKLLDILPSFFFLVFLIRPGSAFAVTFFSSLFSGGWGGRFFVFYSSTTLP